MSSKERSPLAPWLYLFTGIFCEIAGTTGMRADSYRTGHTDPREIAIYSDLQVVSLDWEPIKKNYKVLNTMFNEGLISKEFALDADGSQAKSDFVNGKAGVYGFYLSSNSDVISTLMQNCPDAKLAILDARSGVPAGETLYDYQADPIGISTGISARCKHPEAVMMYINWMAQPEVLEYLEYGDVNLDGIVNDSDLSAIVEFISSGESEFNPLLSDVNFDGVTDGKDVDYLKNYIESSTGVNSISLTPVDTRVYTIEGMRLSDKVNISSLPPGVYIYRGRKFIVK